MEKDITHFLDFSNDDIQKVAESGILSLFDGEMENLEKWKEHQIQEGKNLSDELEKMFQPISKILKPFIDDFNQLCKAETLTDVFIILNRIREKISFEKPEDYFEVQSVIKVAGNLVLNHFLSETYRNKFPKEKVAMLPFLYIKSTKKNLAKEFRVSENTLNDWIKRRNCQPKRNKKWNLLIYYQVFRKLLFTDKELAAFKKYKHEEKEFKNELNYKKEKYEVFEDELKQQFKNMMKNPEELNSSIKKINEGLCFSKNDLKQKFDNKYIIEDLEKIHNYNVPNKIPPFMVTEIEELIN